VFGAVERHGNSRASSAPAPGGGFATADCLRALEQAGFARSSAQVVRGTWRHRDAAELLCALRAGTARMAAMLEAQPDSAMPAILADLESGSAQYRGDGGISVPIACVIVAGARL
jgi:hypothetical protein